MIHSMLLLACFPYIISLSKVGVSHPTRMCKITTDIQGMHPPALMVIDTPPGRLVQYAGI